MNRRVACGLVLSVLLAGCAQHFARVDPDDSPGTGPSVVGQWTPVSAEMGGKDFPVANFGGHNLNLSTSGYEFAGDKGSYTLLSFTPPAHMDIHGDEGPNAGKTIPALWEIAGDQLTICYQLGPGVRPHDFNSAQGAQILVVHYRRAH